MIKTTRLFVAFSLLFFITAGPIFGRDSEETDLAKQAQNPVASLISLPFQNNTNFRALDLA